MTWEVFYFVCFLVGFLLSLLTFLGGSTHLHLPHGAHAHGGLFRGHGPAAHGGAAHGHGHASAKGGSWFNFSTATAFLAWFGGTGYLLSRYSGLWALLALLLSTVSGIVGAAAVFWFLFKFLLAYERDLDPADYNMVGVLGRVSNPVRAGGTGEMIYSRDGGRCCAAIRSDEGLPIQKNVEVVVLRYEKGIAYVRPWEELSNMPAEPWAVPGNEKSGAPIAGQSRHNPQSAN
ncbi:MAG: NfeD family protein [Acidobacteriaceae bacterium]|nr:NfeD family protein [Acidobacteriaceae bacterium]